MVRRTFSAESHQQAGLEFLRLANGKILEEWINEDFLEQLGVVAASGQVNSSVKR